MVAEEVLAAYPAVTHAVSYVELVICDRGDGWSVWEVYAAMPHLTPEKMVAELRETVDASRGEVITDLVVDTIKQEMAHPQFLTYIRGKMGAV